MSNKPRVIKDFEKLTPQIQEQIKLSYPYGFAKHLIEFKDHKGRFVSALPFETDEFYYMVRMTKAEARQIILRDDDYTDAGQLKERIKEKYMDKYSDLDYIDTDDDDEDDLDEDMDDLDDNPKIVPFDEENMED